MNLKVIKKVSRKVKEYSLNFKSDIDNALNAKLSNGVLSSATTVSFKRDFLSDYSPLAVYYANRNHIFYDQNGSLYEIANDKVVQILKLNDTPFCVCGIEDFSPRAYAICTKKGLTITGNLKQIPFPYAKHAVYYNAKLFASDGVNLYILDLLALNEDKRKLFTVNLPKSAGKVRGLSSGENQIYIACEGGLYSFLITQIFSESKIIKLADQIFAPEENTVKTYGNGVVFVANGRIYTYENAKLEGRERLPKGYSLNGAINASVHGNSYIVPLANDSEFCYFIYDLTCDNGYFIDGNDTLITDGGLCLNTKKKRFGVLCENQENLPKITTNPLDFGVLKEKTLTAVCVDCESPTIVKVFGDFGQREFTVSPYRAVELSLYSREFTFEFSGREKTLIKGVKINYQTEN